MHPRDPFEMESEPNDRLSVIFKPPMDIIFTGGLDDGRMTAKNTKKWLLITVVDSPLYSYILYVMIRHGKQ